MGAPEAGWLIGARNRPEKSHAASQADKLDVGERKKDNGHVSRKHSEGLEETFPASDAVAVTEPAPSDDSHR
jgi:hypothetical protein